MGLFLLVILFATGEASIPAPSYPKCLASAGKIIGDPDNCHLYYHCEISPSPMSCGGDMMFNTKTQTCDWPYRVVQFRPECRKLEQFRFRSDRRFPFQRTLRMLSFYEGPTVPFEQKNYQTDFNGNKEEISMREMTVLPPAEDPKIKQTILLEIQRRLPLLLSSKLSHYIQKFNEISRMHQRQSLVVGDPVTLPPPTEPSPTTTTTPTTTRPTTTTTTAPVTFRTIYTYRSNAVPTVHRAVPTLYKDIEINDLRNSIQTEEKILNRLLNKVSPESTSSREVPSATIVPLEESTESISDLRNSIKTEEQTLNRLLQDVSSESTSSRKVSTTSVPFEAAAESVTESEKPWEETETPAPAPVFTWTRGNDRPVLTVTRKRPNLKRCHDSQCPRPRKLVLRRRKVRRKLIRDDKERLQQRRRFLSTLSKPDEVQEEDEVIQQEEDRKTVNDITEDDIERNPTRKKQAYENAIEKLRSLVKEKQSQPLVRVQGPRSGKIVSVTYSTSTDNFRTIKSKN